MRTEIISTMIQEIIFRLNVIAIEAGLDWGVAQVTLTGREAFIKEHGQTTTEGK